MVLVLSKAGKKAEEAGTFGSVGTEGSCFNCRADAVGDLDI